MTGREPQSYHSGLIVKQSNFLVCGFYLIFFVSGVAALVYQVLWLRMFTLVLGNSLFSTSIVLSAFMCGLALGSWLIGKYVRHKKDILLIYVFLELGIALGAILVGKAIPHLGYLVPGLQRWLSFSPFSLNLFRLLVSFLILLVPTVLIGGTLPVLTHFLTYRLEAAGRRIGALYGWNTLGAVIGCAVTGFWLLRAWGLSASLGLAVALNFLVALASLILRYFSRIKSHPVKAAERKNEKAPAVSSSRGIYGLILLVAYLNGAAALAYEVIWARFLSYILGNELYAFSIMLSTILLRISAGSLIYSRWLDRLNQKLRFLGFIEIALGTIMVVCYLFSAILFRSRGLEVFLPFSTAFYNLVAVRILYASAAMFLPAVVMGVSFPLLSRLYLTDENNIGPDVGVVYAVNTAGAVAGSLICGFLLVPQIGIQPSLYLMAATNLIAGCVVLLYESFLAKRALTREIPLLMASVLVFCALCFLPANQIRLFSLREKEHTEQLFYREGLSGTVTVLKDRINGVKTLYINSVQEVPTDFSSMQTFKLLGHLPMLLHSGSPRRVLMVTFGGGVASGAVSRHRIEELDVVELEPAVVDASRIYYEENRGVVDDPRVRIHVEDGRNFLYSTDKKFDAIISDSTNPISTDSWLLYTIEFYQLCRERLAPGGIMAQWLPLHSGTPRTYCTIVKTFQQVFPHTSIWFINDYSLVVGLPEPLSISYSELAEKLSYEPVKTDLAPFCLDSPLELLDCFLLGEHSVRKMTESAQISTDNLPYYQLTLPEKDAQQKILLMLERHREGVFPVLRGVEGEKAQALKDSLEVYFRSEGYLLRRDYPNASAANPSSCKIRRYSQDYLNQVPYAESLLKYHPKSYSMQLQAALTLVSHQKYIKAKEVFTRLASMKPFDADIYSALGNIDFRMGAYKSSAENFGIALALEENNPELMSNLGLALIAAGNSEEALKYLKRAVRIAENNTDALFNLALCYFQTGNRDRAAESYLRIININPYHFDAVVNLGSIYLGSGRLTSAEKLFEKATRLKPDSYHAWSGLGIALYRLGRNTEAGEAFRRALEINPDDKTARNYLERIESTAVEK